jgi:hypothetical protein
MIMSSRATMGVVSLAMATAILSPMTVFADGATQQKKKNDWRNVVIGAGAATLYGATKGDGALTAIGALGTAYAAKKYEDERHAQAQASASRTRYHRSSAAQGYTPRTGYTQTYTSEARYVPGQTVVYNGVSGGIRVRVNGEPIGFTGVQPFETQGTVLVPLRGVFEAMGASVDYNPASRQIFAQRGDQTVILPLGSTVATVDGQQQTLSMPAQVLHGTTMVPLRFVAEALGSNVQWVASNRLVDIQTAGVPVAYQPAPSADFSFTGVARGIATNTDPREITVHLNGRDQTIPLADDAVIWRKSTGAPATQVALSSIMPGDTVAVLEDENGFATRITATYGVRQGTVSSVGTLADGNTLIVLQNGAMVELAPVATVHREGTVVSSRQIEPYDHVTIRTSPSDNLGYSVTLRKNLRAHRRE